jgi:hypothetical protein
MGPRFSIDSSSDVFLNKTTQGNTCEESFEKTRNVIRNKINKIKSRSKSLETSDDYKKYGLYPGQQITRSLRGGILEHVAIYLYDGIIIEMGSAPEKCKRDPIHFMNVKTNAIGLSTLAEFRNYSGGNIRKIISEKDSDVEEIIKRLTRALEIIGMNKYHFLFRNCRHLFNYISYGKYSMISPHNTKSIKFFGISKKRFSKKRFSKKRSRPTRRRN